MFTEIKIFGKHNRRCGPGKLISCLLSREAVTRGDRCTTAANIMGHNRVECVLVGHVQKGTWDCLPSAAVLFLVRDGGREEEPCQLTLD